MADGLTKALLREPFNRFTEMIGLEDQAEKLKSIQKEEELKEQIKELRSNERIEKVRYVVSKDMGNESRPMLRSQLED